MTYKTYASLRVWLAYFVIFLAMALALRIGHNLWKGEPPLSLIEGVTAAVLPIVFATGLTFRWSRK